MCVRARARVCIFATYNNKRAKKGKHRKVKKKKQISRSLKSKIVRIFFSISKYNQISPLHRQLFTNFIIYYYTGSKSLNPLRYISIRWVEKSIFFLIFEFKKRKKNRNRRDFIPFLHSFHKERDTRWDYVMKQRLRGETRSCNGVRDYRVIYEQITISVQLIRAYATQERIR